MISCHLLRLPLAASQRLASLLLLLMLMMQMMLMLVVLVVLVVLMLMVLVLVVTIICSGWAVDNPQARTAVVVDREGTAAVFMVNMMISMASMVCMVMTKLSRVVVD